MGKYNKLLNAASAAKRFYVRYPIAGVATVLGGLLVILFRGFLISDTMLLSHDIIDVGVFFRTYLRDHLLTYGSLPLWNPYHLCGLPFIDAIHGGALYPLTLISLIGSVPRAVGFSFIFHYFLAGIFAYLAAREIGLGKLPALLVALCYSLSPSLISWVVPGHDGKLFVATWFPLIVYLVQRLRKSPSLHLCGALGLVMAVSILTPHLQAVYYVLLFLLFYCIYHIGVELYHRKSAAIPAKFATFVVAGVALGAIISSVQWIPSYRHIVEFSPRAATDRGVEFANAHSMHEEELISIVIPQFAGVDIPRHERTYWGKNSFKDNSEAVGVLPFLLAVMAFIVPGFRREKVAWLIVSVAVLLYALGTTTPVFKWIVTVVPLTDRMRAPSTSMFILAFAVSILAGIGVQNMMEHARQAACNRCRAARWTVVASIVLFGLASVIAALGLDDVLALYTEVAHPDIAPGGPEVHDRWQFAQANIPALTTGLWVATGLLIGVYLAFFAGDRARTPSLRVWTVVVLVVIGHYHFDQRFILTADYQSVFGRGEIPRFLRQSQGIDRTLGYEVPSRWFRFGYHGIYSLDGEHDKPMKWYTQFVGGRFRGHLSNPRIINLTGTRYLMTRSSEPPPPHALGKQSLRTEVSSNGWTVLGNPNALPRVYLASQVKVFDNSSAMIDAVLHGRDNLEEVVYLEHPPDQGLSETDSTDNACAEVLAYHSDSVSVEVSVSTRRILVLTDTYHPNWHVYVDGTRCRLLRAYGAFRAVIVPPGASTVVFRYEDSLHQVTRNISVIFLLVAGLLVSTRWIGKSRSDQ